MLPKLRPFHPDSACRPRSRSWLVKSSKVRARCIRQHCRRDGARRTRARLQALRRRTGRDWQLLTARTIPAPMNRDATEAAQQRQIVKWRAILIVTVAYAEMSSSRGGWNASCGFRAQRFGSSRDGTVFPLIKTLIDAESLVGVWHRSACQCLRSDQPDALQKIDEQQRRSGKLRGAESIGMKKSAQHFQQDWRNKARPSVLPCPGR